MVIVCVFVCLFFVVEVVLFFCVKFFLKDYLIIFVRKLIFYSFLRNFCEVCKIFFLVVFMCKGLVLMIGVVNEIKVFW